MEVHVGNLMLEVTRRCNMCCTHCLRGEAENLDMSKETIDHVLEQVDSISTVSFTGGEPTLNLPIIEYFFDKAKELHKMPLAFWLATNGKEYQVELASLLLKIFPEMDEPDACGVALSSDGFHDDVKTNFLKGLVFYDDSKNRGSSTEPNWIIGEGRAKEWGENEFPHSKLEIEPWNWNGREGVNVETVYVNACGQWLADCDYSYESQQNEVIGDIKDLREDLSAYCAIQTAC